MIQTPEAKDLTQYCEVAQSRTAVVRGSGRGSIRKKSLDQLCCGLRGSLAICALALWAGLASAGEVNAPPAAASYQLRFADEFDKLDLSPDGLGANTWYEGVWFNHNHAPLYNISVAGSELSLVWRAGQRSFDTSIVTFSHDKLHATTWRYGYFEIRAKWDVVKGAWPAFWLIPVQNATGQDVYRGVKESGELDIFEGQGAEPHTYYGTIHDWIAGRDIKGSKNNFALRSDQDFSQFHTYAVLWVPGKVTWYLDNEPLHSEATPSVFDRQDFYLVLGMQEGVGWHPGDITGVDANKMTLVIDWVRVWQSSGNGQRTAERSSQR